MTLLDINRFRDYLRDRSGILIPDERISKMIQEINLRMACVGIDNYEGYWHRIHKDLLEYQALLVRFSVHETYFFREPAQFRFFSSQLPAIRHGRPLRILSAGCSTGEEVYSIVIELLESNKNASLIDFIVQGVDLDNSVLEKAKKGVYGQNSFRNFPKQLLEKYFIPLDENCFQVCDLIREKTNFSYLDLSGEIDTQYSRVFDIIFYRNVSIYFSQSFREQIFRNLLATLVDNGLLFLSATEIFSHSNLSTQSNATLEKEDDIYFFRKNNQHSIQNETISVPKNLPSLSPQASFAAVKKMAI